MVEYEPNSGCHIWLGPQHPKGYGKYKGKLAHRVIWELTHGQIQTGLQVDHICRVRACVNPSHLRLVTSRVNTLENSEGIAARNLRKTHCYRGHEFTPENTRIESTGWRQCRACKRIKGRAQRERRHAVGSR